MSVDPLAEKFPWVSVYNYAENSPIANIDLWGLQAVSIHSASFAPFNRFGGPFKGDGDTRSFSTNSHASSRIRGQINLNATSDRISIVGSPIATGSVSHIVGTSISTYSEAAITAELMPADASGNFSSASDLSFHLSGNNDLVPGSPDIDTKGDFAIGRIDTEGGSVRLEGDQFGQLYRNFIKKIRKMIPPPPVNSVVFLFMICLSSECYAQEGYTTVDAVEINKNELFYNSVGNQVFLLSDSLELGYMGVNDSLTILLDGKVLFEGRTSYDPRSGYGRSLVKVSRSGLRVPCQILVLLHGLKQKFVFLVEDKFNSILILNQLNYEEMAGEFDPYLTVYYYWETGQFH